MDVSACPLLRQLYLTDVCGAQGWISRGKLLVWVDVSDKVHIIFCLTEGRKWNWQLGAQWWLWFWCEMEIYADTWDINARLLCGSRRIWSVISVLCSTALCFTERTHPKCSLCPHHVYHSQTLKLHLWWVSRCFIILNNKTKVRFCANPKNQWSCSQNLEH